MEFFPEEIRSGLSPLVFAIDAVLPSPGEKAAEAAAAAGGDATKLGSSALGALLQAYSSREGRVLCLRDNPGTNDDEGGGVNPQDDEGKVGEKDEGGETAASPKGDAEASVGAGGSEGPIEVSLPAGPVRIKFRGAPPTITEVADDSPLASLVRVGQVIERVAVPDETDEDKAAKPFRRFVDVIARTAWGEEGDELGKSVHTAGTAESDTLSVLLEDSTSFRAEGSGDDRATAATEDASLAVDSESSQPPPPPPMHPAGRSSSFRSASPSIGATGGLQGLGQRFSKTILGSRHGGDNDGASSQQIPFFQRARTLSVRRRHAFPPSKDPGGANGRITRIVSRSGTVASALYGRSFDKDDEEEKIEGILPAGWIVKHAHALPSALMLVTSLDMSKAPMEQDKQDAYLVETVETLRMTLASKRECPIHVVAIGNDNSGSAGSGEGGDVPGETERLVSLRQRCRLAASAVSILRPSVDFPSLSAAADSRLNTTPSLRRLHRSVRDASRDYYQAQARRAKRKHSSLPSNLERNRLDLLPLAARYCLKVAFFSELQGRPDKGLRCYRDAYRYLESYYSYLIRNITGGSDKEGGGGDVDGSGAEVSTTDGSGGYGGGNNGDGEGVEVGLTGSLMNPSDEEEGKEDTAEESEEGAAGDGTASSHFDVRKAKAKEDAAAMTAAADALHQCRAVASWTNLKLLQGAFAAATSLSEGFLPSEKGADAKVSVEGGGGGGYVAAAAQWRKHRLTFLSERPGVGRDAVYTQDGGSSPLLPPWHVRSYALRETLVMSQLCERNQPQKSALWGTKGPLAEALLTCSAWRQYAAAAEASSRLAGVIGRERANKEKGGDAEAEQSEEKGGIALKKQIFVGGLGSNGLNPEFAVEVSKDHGDLVLSYAIHALSLLANESQTPLSDVAKGAVTAVTSGEAEKARGASRLHYLVAGALYKKRCYADAAHHLDSAGSEGLLWPGVELPIKRALLRCLDRMSDQEREDFRGPDAGDVCLGMLLSTSNAGFMDRTELDVASKVAFRVSALLPSSILSAVTKSVVWPDLGAGGTAPFQFATTFPQRTHATSGDVVTAVVSLRSRLRIPIRLLEVSISTTVGEFEVPLHALCGRDGSLLGEQTCRDGDASGLVLPGSETFWLVRISLPSKIDVPRLRKVDQKLKPKTAGMTRAAGSCFAQLSSTTHGIGDSAAQPGVASSSPQGNNSRLIGGKPVSCLGMELTMRHPEDVLGTNSRSISLMLRNKPRESPNAPGITKGQSRSKKVLIEEDNYVLSAWDRPEYHNLLLGPRCLRVNAPLPYLQVTNLTALITKGKVMEGTVNRILLRIKAGENERCRDLSFSVTCASTMSFSEGGVLEAPKTEPSVARPPKRLPMLVKQDISTDYTHQTEEGYQLPQAWKPHGGESGQGSLGELTLVVSELDPDEVAFLSFDIFRPLPLQPTIGSTSFDDVGKSTEGSGDMSCWTNFSVNITYHQNRPHQPEGEEDLVTREFQGSVVWTPPIRAMFAVPKGPQKAYPSGSCHPSNLISKGMGLSPTSEPHLEADATRPTSEAGGDEAAAIDGEDVRVRCTLQAEGAAHGLAVKLERVLFEASDERIGEDETKCDLLLVSEDPAASDGVLFAKEGDDLCINVLKEGSRFGLSYSVQANLSHSSGSATENEGNYVRTSLGVLSIDFIPVSLDLPSDALPWMQKKLSQSTSAESRESEAINLSHGPLPMLRPSTIKFFGPLCYIEKSPFEAKLTSFPTVPKVAVPFEIIYCITNKTAFHQILKLTMREASAEDHGAHHASNSVLVSGLVNGEINLAPLESRVLSYSALAVRAGKIPMPALAVSSTRHKSWVINDGPHNPRFIFILP